MDSIINALEKYLEFEKRHYRNRLHIKKLNPFKTLYEQLMKCENCELHRNIHNKVAGYGNHNAKLILIGEAPGENEDLQGKPFVGRAGEKLTGMLEYINLKREDVYITNVVKCRPPNNKDPEKQWIDACSIFLKNEIELIKPQFIMPLGRFASKWILGVQGKTMASMRGQYYEKNGIIIVPTYHPSSLLMQKGSRRQEIRKRIAEDLKLLKSLMDGKKC